MNTENIKRLHNKAKKAGWEVKRSEIMAEEHDWTMAMVMALNELPKDIVQTIMDGVNPAKKKLLF
jgi:hypothetical protein